MSNVLAKGMYELCMRARAWHSIREVEAEMATGLLVKVRRVFSPTDMYCRSESTCLFACACELVLKHNGSQAEFQKLLRSPWAKIFMTTEAVLASLHLLAVLTLVVFLSSQAALCRMEWLNAAVVERLVHLDRIAGAAAVLVLASGLGRVFWGVKGIAWYTTQPLLYWKAGLFVSIAIAAIVPSLAFRRWRRQLHATGALPGMAEIAKVRRWVMVQSHILPVVAVIAVFWARGW